MGCKECGKPKCNGDCGCKSPKVLQINNPAEYITFHKVSIPAAMGDSTTNPPKIGAYRNALVYYEADHTSWMYSTDGIPTKLTNGLTDYNEAVNLPQINGHTLIGNQSSPDLGLQGELTAGNGIKLDGAEIKAKIGDGLEFDNNGEINIANIKQYAHFFDTVADMVSSENLVKGSKAKTLGKNTVDDGYGAIYEITDAATDIALNNGLYAQIKTRTYGDNYFKDIEVESSRVFDTTNETDVYYATIPVTDYDGTPINPYVGEVEEETLTPSQYARANYTTITTNAGLTQKNSSGQWKQAIVIGNGQVLNTYEAEQTPASYMRYLAFKDNRVVTDFPASTTTADMMLAQGVKNAFLVFQKVIDNGSVTIAQERDTADVDNRMMLGVKLDGTIVIVCADGNTPRSGGLTIRECANLLLAKGCINAWEMDGGGSASLNYKGQKINHNKDSHQTIDRGIWVTLNFKRETVDKTIGDLYNQIGEVKQKLNKEIRDDIRATDNTGALYISAGDGANENIVTANNAWQDANLRFRYRHNQNIITPYQTSTQSAISDPVNYCGFTAHKAGLYKINVTSCVKFRKDDQSKNSGRAIRIVNENGQSPTVDPAEWITPDLTNNNGNVCYQICTTMMVNANTEELSFKLQVRGTKSDSYADNFQRIKMTVEYCGSASY